MTSLMDFKVIEQTLPVYWASYLVNGDGSGLEDGEDKQVAETLSRLELSDCECVDVKDDSHFHTPDPYMNWLDAGDFATYVFHKRQKLQVVAEQELRQEEINHPEKTVHGRAFIKNFDD
tara:strand:+ start:187 stop:543 length:357 start_codon:yes stop_codon:yes gene_type:complete